MILPLSEISIGQVKGEKMNLSAPKKTTWWLAFVLGVLGIVGNYVSLPIISPNDYWFVVAGFVLLTLATLLKNF
jgi:hypothetical protein